MNAPLESYDAALQKELQQQQIRDLLQRSWPGVLTFPLIWWTLALPSLWYAPTNQNFFWLGGIGLLILFSSGIRIQLLRRLRQRLACQDVKTPWEISSGVALTGSVWGLATAISLVPSHPLTPFDTLLLAATAGICAGGVCALAISGRLVFLFLTSMLLPSIIVMALGHTDYATGFAVALVFFWLGMYWISRLPRKEYTRAVISNIQLVRQSAHLDELTRMDPLTGLKNRRHFENLFEAELKRASRNHYPVNLLLIDLDHFRSVNEQHGHLAGDECLKAAGSTLKGLLKRSTDEVTRYGGEEFAVILPGISQADALQMAETIRTAIAGLRVLTGEAVISFTTSVGVASLIPDQNTTTRDLIKLADDALYQAKITGRNRVCLAQEPALPAAQQ